MTTFFYDAIIDHPRIAVLITKRFYYLLLMIVAALLAAWFFGIRPLYSPGADDRGFVYPRWQQENGAVWTVIGRPGETDEAIVGPGGEIQPWNTSFTVSFWFYDRDNRKLYAPDNMPLKSLKWELLDGFLPITVSTWNANDVTVEVTNSYGTHASSRVRLTNKRLRDRHLYLYAVIRPQGIAAKYGSVDSLRLVSGAVFVNGRRAIEPLDRVFKFGASSLATNGIDGDISTFASRGKLPETQSVSGSSTGAFRYEVYLESGEHTAEYGFVYPPRDSAVKRIAFGDVKAGDMVCSAAFEWESLLSEAVCIEIPDRRIQDCFYASLAYLLILKDGPYTVPGPLAYNSIWVRDAAYMTDALYKSGFRSEADETLQALIKLQHKDGLMQPVFTLDEKPYARDEWDAQGQLVYMVSQRYRLTGDKTWLAANYPAVEKSCRYIRKLRQKNLAAKLKYTPAYGILPPSLSAEDIGSAAWHHYWDDFWAVYALEESAELALALGKTTDASWMAKEAVDLRNATLRSIKLASGGLSWIPNGPEDLKSSSAARGTTAAVWPARVLSESECRETFNSYWNRWVGPYSGGFMHGKRYWPYATLSLAHAYLWNGDGDKAFRMLRWTLDNQTAPGVYAWSEVVNPQNMRFGGGDMPHGWGAAEYVLLVRDMLVRDDGLNVTLLSGVPKEWLSGGKVIKVDNAPVRGGKIGFEVLGLLDKGRVELRILPSTRLSKPVEVCLPAGGIKAMSDKGQAVQTTGNRVVLPAGTTRAVITMSTGQGR